MVVRGTTVQVTGWLPALIAIAGAAILTWSTAMGAAEKNRTQDDQIASQATELREYRDEVVGMRSDIRVLKGQSAEVRCLIRAHVNNQAMICEQSPN